MPSLEDRRLKQLYFGQVRGLLLAKALRIYGLIHVVPIRQKAVVHNIRAQALRIWPSELPPHLAPLVIEDTKEKGFYARLPPEVRHNIEEGAPYSLHKLT